MGALIEATKTHLDPPLLITVSDIQELLIPEALKTVIWVSVVQSCTLKHQGWKEKKKIMALSISP